MVSLIPLIILIILIALSRRNCQSWLLAMLIVFIAFFA